MASFFARLTLVTKQVAITATAVATLGIVLSVLVLDRLDTEMRVQAQERQHANMGPLPGTSSANGAMACLSESLNNQVGLFADLDLLGKLAKEMAAVPGLAASAA